MLTAWMRQQGLWYEITCPSMHRQLKKKQKEETLIVNISSVTEEESLQINCQHNSAVYLVQPLHSWEPNSQGTANYTTSGVCLGLSPPNAEKGETNG